MIEAGAPGLHVPLWIVVSAAICFGLMLIWTIVLALRPRSPKAPRMADPVRQLDAVRNVDFEVKPLMSRAEARILPLLEAALSEYAPDHRVMMQVALQELIQPTTDAPETALRRADASIKSKRIDMAIVDGAGRLVAALGSQGPHCPPIRDAVRREALRSAGIPYLDLGETTDELTICTFVEANVGRHPLQDAGAIEVNAA